MSFDIFNHPKECYVYLYLREDGSPYYVGKGTGGRTWSKEHRLNLPPHANRIKIVSHRLSHEEAYLLEKKLIKEFGRKDNGTGILRNQTGGGQGVDGYWTEDRVEEYLSTAARRLRVQRHPITQWQNDNPIDYSSPLSEYQAAHLEWSRELALETYRKKFNGEIE